MRAVVSQPPSKGQHLARRHRPTRAQINKHNVVPNRVFLPSSTTSPLQATAARALCDAMPRMDSGDTVTRARQLLRDDRRTKLCK